MSGSREIFYFGKDFSGTDIYHSDIKNALLQIKIFFAYEKLFFKIRNIFYDEMLVRSKFSPKVTVTECYHHHHHHQHLLAVRWHKIIHLKK